MHSCSLRSAGYPGLFFRVNPCPWLPFFWPHPVWPFPSLHSGKGKFEMDKRRFWLEVLGCGGGAGFCWPRYSCKIQLKGWLCMLMEAQITAFTKPSLQTGLKMPFCDFNVSPLHPPRERETRNSSSLKITKSQRTSQMACPPRNVAKWGSLLKSEVWVSRSPGALDSVFPTSPWCFHAAGGWSMLFLHGANPARRLSRGGVEKPLED